MERSVATCCSDRSVPETFSVRRFVRLMKGSSELIMLYDTSSVSSPYSMESGVTSISALYERSRCFICILFGAS